MNLQISSSDGFSQSQSRMEPMISGYTAEQQKASSEVPPGVRVRQTQPNGAESQTQSRNDVITDLSRPQPMTTESLQYLNGFLRTQIGSRIKVEFLVGTNTYLEKSGKLLAVGANFIILQEAMSDDLIVCDFFNIKFITIYR